MKLEEIINEIRPLDQAALQSARARQDTLTKPRGSLGRLEELSIRLAGMKADPFPSLEHKAVIVVAVEDEYLPGKAKGDSIGDERRLLYVSLTRAKHFLFMTYCEQRTGQQQYTGRTSGKPQRSLTQFLRDGPITPSQGEDYTRDI